MTKKSTLIIALLCITAIHKTNAMEKQLEFIPWNPLKHTEFTRLLNNFNHHPLNQNKIIITPPAHRKAKQKQNWIRWVLYESDINTPQPEQFKPFKKEQNKGLEKIITIKINFNKTTDSSKKTHSINTRIELITKK